MIVWRLVFWSVATGVVPLATGFATLLALRAAVAAGESTYYPTATALIDDWHPSTTRSRALSAHQTAMFAGLVGGRADRRRDAVGARRRPAAGGPPFQPD